MQANCPICNEPVVKMRLRSDRLARGGPIVKVCQGEQGPAETMVIELERSGEVEGAIAHE